MDIAIETQQLRRAHEHFRANEGRYRTLFELGPVAVYCCDSLGVLQEFNRRAVELWGREPVAGDPDERFCGSLRLIRPDGNFMPHEQCPVADVLSGKLSEVRESEVLIERPDGSVITVIVNVSPLKNQHGEITGAINCFYDVTERKQAEKKLHGSELRYRRLFESAHDGILILDVETAQVIDVNPFMLGLLGMPREHFVGKELWELGVFRDKAESQQAMRQLQREGSIRYENLPFQHRDGHRIHVEFVSNVYLEEDQTVIQCNIRDISDRMRFEEERKAHLANEQSLRKEAESANRAKDLFLATLSHEIRTPLNAIVGWMSILRSKECDASDLQEGLAVIDRNTKAQVQLVEDVLDVSRIVSGKLRLEICPCELINIIRAGLDVVRSAAKARDIELDVDLDPSASQTSCDPARIQQVIWNLLSNAIKFTPKKGTVGVRLDRDQSSLRIQVSDNGQGIPPDLLPYVFDRFRQADSSTRRRFGGLGLGLSIVRHIIELHGGTVDAQSTGEGHGSTFTVRLPISAVRLDESGDEPWGTAADGNSADAATAALPLIRLDGLRVLVVDDEADARRLLIKVLEKAGAIVTAAASVVEALDAIAKSMPEVLVSDMGMPDQDGVDLIRQVRGRGHRSRDLPAVALTAFVSKEDQRRALLAGFQVHVPKPVDPQDLTAVIASLAGRTG